MRFMRLYALPLCVLSAFVLFRCGNKKIDSSNESQQLFSLERQAISREFQNDTAYLSSLMDSTFIELSRGKIKNKHDVLRTIYQDNVANQQNQISRDSFLLQDSVIHVYGNTAVITFIMQTYNRKGDSSFIRRTRFYDVWVKRNNGWKAITWQGSAAE
jgi:hypothetical protein